MSTSTHRIEMFSLIYLLTISFFGLLACGYILYTNLTLHNQVFNTLLILGILATFGTLSILLFKIETRINLALTHFFFLITLFIFNASLLIWEEWQETSFNIADLAESMGVEFDQRDKMEVVADLKEEGIQSYPAVTFHAFLDNPAFFEQNYGLQFEADNFFPLSGISKVTTVFCNESGQRAIYQADRYGFNNDDTIYDKPGETIILVGDSFTQGACVETENSVAGQLQQKKYKAISLGIGGNGPLGQLAAIREYGKQLDTKVVLWMYYSNDFFQVNAEYQFPPLRQYLQQEHSQNLVLRQQEVDAFWFETLNKISDSMTENLKLWNEQKSDKITGIFRNLVSLSNVRNLLALHRDDPSLLKQQKNNHEEATKNFRHILQLAKQEAQALESEIHFVFIPGCNRSGYVEASQTVREIVRELQIPLIDFDEIMAQWEDPLAYFPLRHCSFHYNAAGYASLADHIEHHALSPELAIQ